jgi:hypothetical protein
MQKKSAKLRVPSAAKLAALQAAGMVVGMEASAPAPAAKSRPSASGARARGKKEESEDEEDEDDEDDEDEDEDDEDSEEEDGDDGDDEDDDEDDEDDDEDDFDEDDEDDDDAAPAKAIARVFNSGCGGRRAASAAAAAASGATLLASMDGAARAQCAVLGLEARARLLATLYLTRSDTSQVVRQASLNVWKAVVSNTPRTLREVLPSLVAILVRDLSALSDERRLVASRCLGDVVRKLGDRVLPDVIPTLRRGLSDPQEAVRMIRRAVELVPAYVDAHK